METANVQNVIESLSVEEFEWLIGYPKSGDFPSDPEQSELVKWVKEYGFFGKKQLWLTETAVSILTFLRNQEIKEAAQKAHRNLLTSRIQDHFGDMNETDAMVDFLIEQGLTVVPKNLIDEAISLGHVGTWPSWEIRHMLETAMGREMYRERRSDT